MKNADRNSNENSNLFPNFFFTNNLEGHQTVAVTLDQLNLQLKHLTEILEQSSRIVERTITKDGKVIMPEYLEVMDNLKKIQDSIELFEEVTKNNYEQSVLYLHFWN